VKKSFKKIKSKLLANFTECFILKYFKSGKIQTAEKLKTAKRLCQIKLPRPWTFIYLKWQLTFERLKITPAQLRNVPTEYLKYYHATLYQTLEGYISKDISHILQQLAAGPARA
jgi:hypothetical protein